MKKLLFTALIVGLFGAQSLAAQNYIEVANISVNGSNFIALSSEDTKSDGSNLCYDDSSWTSSEVSRYSWNSTTNILTLPNGTTFEISDQTTITDYNTSFGSRQNLIVSSDAGFTSATGLQGSINELGVYVSN